MNHMKIEVVGDGEMNAELYVTKASLQMSRGENGKSGGEYEESR